MARRTADFTNGGRDTARRGHRVAHKIPESGPLFVVVVQDGDVPGRLQEHGRNSVSSPATVAANCLSLN